MERNRLSIIDVSSLQTLLPYTLENEHLNQHVERN